MYLLPCPSACAAAYGHKRTARLRPHGAFARLPGQLFLGTDAHPVLQVRLHIPYEWLLLFFLFPALFFFMFRTEVFDLSCNLKLVPRCAAPWRWARCMGPAALRPRWIRVLTRGFAVQSLQRKAYKQRNKNKQWSVAITVLIFTFLSMPSVSLSSFA